MLAKSYRLRKFEVERLYKKGRTFRQDFVLVRFAPNRAGHARFAVVIPKKVLARATDRNRLKRQIFQVLASEKALWQDKNLDISLALRQPTQEINPVLKQILTKIS